MSTFVANCKAIAGRTSNCQVMTGRSKKFCKVFLGRDICLFSVQACMLTYSADVTTDAMSSEELIFTRLLIQNAKSYANTANTK